MSVIRLRGIGYKTIRRLVQWINDAQPSLDTTQNILAALYVPDGAYAGTFTLAAAGAVTVAVTGHATWRINGQNHFGTLPATVTLEDLGDILQNQYGAWRVLVDRLGALTTQASPTVGGETTAQKALASLASLAPTANTATLGYITIIKTGSAFNIGTDNTNVATSTLVAYYERLPRKRVSGLNAARSVATSANAGATTLTDGTINVNVNGLKVAQIAASATRALTDADTIATLKYGAWLVCTDLAGTAVFTLNAAGTPGVVAMSYATAAAARAAIDLVVDRLPAMFVPLAIVSVYNGAAGTFTAKTTFWDATSVVTTVTDATLAGWNRTVPTGFDSHQVMPITIPSAIDTFRDAKGAP